MATVHITVADDLVPRLRIAMRGTFPQYEALGDAAAFKAATADFWRGVLVAWEEQQARIDAAVVAQQAGDLARDLAVNDSLTIT